MKELKKSNKKNILKVDKLKLLFVQWLWKNNLSVLRDRVQAELEEDGFEIIYTSLYLPEVQPIIFFGQEKTIMLQIIL